MPAMLGKKAYETYDRVTRSMALRVAARMERKHIKKPRIFI